MSGCRSNGNAFWCATHQAKWSGGPTQKQCDALTVDLEADLVAVVTDAMAAHPRSQQVAIGPSELGTPCQRKLAYKLGRLVEDRRSPDWRPWVGTAIHAQLEETFTRRSIAPGPEQGRWLTEVRVSVGEVAGVEVTGSCDLFDTLSGTVVDWKATTRNKLRSYRSQGPGEQYRAQAHLYGRGFTRRGETVRTVGIFFWTRDGSLSDRYLWHEPYDEAVAVAALDRATVTSQLLDALGPDTALGLWPAVDDHCQFCPAFRPGHAGPLSQECPGALPTPEPSTTLAGALGLGGNR